MILLFFELLIYFVSDELGVMGDKLGLGYDGRGGNLAAPRGFFRKIRKKDHTILYISVVRRLFLPLPPPPLPALKRS